MSAETLPIRLAALPSAEPEPRSAPKRKSRCLIRSKGFAGRLAISMPTFDRMKAAGKIGPTPIRLSRGCHQYDLREVEAWIDARKPDGSLPTAAEWPAIWQQLRKKQT